MNPTMLITGAAGFIGRAACERYRDYCNVIAIDDMSRPTAVIPPGVTFLKADAANCDLMALRPDVILHLAAQVSVVDSIKDPRDDFWRNAHTTFSLAEWARHLPNPPKFIYASTNKVFGDLANGPRSPMLDSWPIDPCTPYGISKAMGALYVREFLPSTGYVFHQSCIFGEDQIGSENQGWIGHIREQIRKGEPITCFGSGSQVRDLLNVSDLLDAYDMAIAGDIPAGSYIVGGGEENAFSFWGAVDALGGCISKHMPTRMGDQFYFVAASDGLRNAGWRPKVSAPERLRAWRKQ